VGVFDTYGEAQIKAGSCSMYTYNIGDKCDLQDGVYVAYEGVVVVVDSIFVAFYEELRDKWGGTINPESIIDDFNPVKVFLDEKSKDS